ncbi:MAG: TetR family transcriptional regulator [Halomonadaceae bacterium]|nr:MAG: TetR family transcriptional regulator [Halomonadaceae bacterium]
MRRTKEEAEKTRHDIIKAALTLFSQQGYSNTTLAMIAREAGFSRGPIYWHFQNKEDLYEAVLAYSQEPLDALVAHAAAGKDLPSQAIHRFISQWFELLLEDTWFCQSFEILLNKTELTEGMASTLSRERQLTRHIVETLTELIVEAQNQTLIPALHSASRLALLLYSSLMGITQSWLFSPSLFSLKDEQVFFVERLMGLLEQE